MSIAKDEKGPTMNIEDIKTIQQAFDFVVEGLAKQGGPSFGPAPGTCMYRGEEGRKCALGLVIRDEDYRPKLEGNSVPALMNELEGTPSWSLIANHLNFWKGMQRAHDTAFSKDGLWVRPWDKDVVKLVSSRDLDSDHQEHGIAWALEVTGQGWGLDTSVVERSFPR